MKNTTKNTLKNIACSIVSAAALATFSTGAVATEKMVGSGSSFIYPVMSAWTKDFSRSHDGVQIDYQSKGSGAGVRDLISGVVNFSVSDAAMNAEEAAQVKGGVVFLPVTAGEIVLSYNLKGIDSLKLSREVYSDIFKGNITRWNDASIAVLNPGVTFPDRQITVVNRADSSGTTYAFTNHLSAIDPVWADQYGTGKSVQWPQQANFIAAPRNDGVAATIMQTPGAIGYMEYSYAAYTRQPMAKLENASGNYVTASATSGAAALANVQWPENLIAFAADPQGADAWPITTFTWMMVAKQNPSPQTAKLLREFVNYILTDGQVTAEKMGYIPVPANLKARMKQAAEHIQ